MSDYYALCVDGGGTKTEVWLARFDAAGHANIIGRGKGASSNPRAVGFEPAMTHLSEAITAAWTDAGEKPATVDAVLLALSGAGHQSMRDQIASWANERRLARMVLFEHDIEPVLAEGTPEGWGVALIVGTGSAAIGVTASGQRLVVGGWGYHYGDEGSAYWIGRRALEAVARADDGRSPATAISAAFLERLHVSEPRAMLGALEQTGNVRGAIASLADCVERAARDGDAVALRIVDVAADELAAMIATLVQRLPLGPDFPLAMAGGVICGSELLRTRLLDRLSVQSLQPSPVKTVPHPVAGCVRLAWRALSQSLERERK